MTKEGAREKVALIGSGNWGTVISRIIGGNVTKYNEFQQEVKMWVFEEIINGRKLTDLINEKHENVKYLPGFAIPENVKAVPDLLDVVNDATILVFCIPHQAGIRPMSEVINKSLSISVCSLSGANIANEIAEEKFSETTIGFNNVIAIGGGIVDGLKLGENTKAAIIRSGFLEMKKFIKWFYSGIKDETFFESCGIADVIATSYGGRNRKVAESFVITGKPFDQLEKELLQGQKLQGTLTVKEINRVLSRKGLNDEFKLFTTIYRIAFEGLPPKSIAEDII
ncbi:22432_t:CDS:2 [Cetraspora pellucida]|uniref:Glycerol-3-phosphate dehydrogenase [NAD(+)] n=1 Tax=Cetraspora pellucida TaxID=1433469 RepID=A0A9N8YVB9_9GLOM|nr:22432_t:CDS:2 [Cetraspora pellucida]